MSWFLYRLHADRPDFAATMTEEEAATMMAHVEYWRGPLDEGRVLIYSPVADPEHGWGMAVVEADDEAELDALRAADPAVLAGVATADYLHLPVPVVAPRG
ncbi:YciI family protein [Nocardioides sp. SYSU D00038]|uniref:YciI family protein n=1 Tax=Nocardioides sp. SYSU D00038 TaxID=2812554 RepID=UPI0019684A49|nr:YciI family protein [Nocardioides sp. SYSU D00038]